MKYTVTMTQNVEVLLSPTHLNEKFLREFRESHYPFHTLEDHAAHLGQLAMRGLLRDFVDGYGPLSKLKIIVGEPETDEVEARLLAPLRRRKGKTDGR